VERFLPGMTDCVYHAARFPCSVVSGIEKCISNFLLSHFWNKERYIRKGKIGISVSYTYTRTGTVPATGTRYRVRYLSIKTARFPLKIYQE
jgi:hypothetical protein